MSMFWKALIIPKLLKHSRKAANRKLVFSKRRYSTLCLFFTVSFSEELTKKLSILLKCGTKLVSAKPRDSRQFGVAASSDQKPCHLCFQQTLALLEESV